ncbi:conserved hypothetical protein [hydrothermal vent metagenome]|uniref:GyrI-like small molecule binding domain-containing protein n=2 Tax=hydrothermal vent metagenome TaxID=652676 RepID=A0A3B0V3P1_9ZZZZ
MKKIDFKRELKHLYNNSAKKITFIDVPTMNFLMVTGGGGPNAQAYKDAVSALYSVSYAVKFMVKKGEIAIDYGVMPLEGLWWVDDMAQFSMDDKESWQWQAMMMQPDFITADLITQAKEQVKRKKGLPAVDQLEFGSFVEGQAAQIMHIGPYADEGPTIQNLHEQIWERGGELTGKHHEVYLNDPTRTAPERLKTIIRQPFLVAEAVVTS